MRCCLRASSETSRHQRLRFAYQAGETRAPRSLGLFLGTLMHLKAALFHGWLSRDDVFQRMMPWR
jgi:cytochrome b561